RGLPCFFPGRQTVRFHQWCAKVAGIAVSLSSGEAEWTLAFRPPAPSGKTHRRPVHDQVHAHRPVQPRPGAIAGANRERAPRVRLVWLLGGLWARHREPKFARLHRPTLRRQVAGRREATVGLWFPAQCLSGSAVSLSWGASAVL